MRSFLTYHLLPLLISSILFLGIFKFTSVHSLFAVDVKDESITGPEIKSGYYDNYKEGRQGEYDLCYGLRNKSIIILGSSELTESSSALPFRFIPEKTGYPTLGFGHAGNQCLCILTQLAALHDYLDDSKIVIIVSPGWFSTEGTSLESFLEFNNNRFLVNCINNPGVPGFVKSHVCKYVAKHFHDITSPSTVLRLMNSVGRSEENKAQHLFYSPVRKSNALLLAAEIKFRNTHFNELQGQYKYNLPEVKSEHLNMTMTDEKINWPELNQVAIDSEEINTTSNQWGIYNDYYSKYINGKQSKVDILREENNNEWDDFKVLVKYLKSSNVNASFIIQPLNPYYYKNLSELDPLIVKIQDEIRSNDFKCLNLFVKDTAQYEKPLLKDVMHLGDYGWYKMDRFIIDNYISNK